jgi:hypothetical protein
MPETEKNFTRACRERGEKYWKIWLEPQVKIKYLNDFKVKERKEIMRIVEKNIDLLKAKWYEFF